MDNKTIGQRIRELRKKKGMPQDELAKKAGYSDKTAISKIEKDQREPTRSKIVTLAKLLGTTPGYLMGWDDETVNTISVNLTNEEQHLITSFRKLNPDGQTAALAAVNGFTMLDQYVIKKCDDISEIS